MTTTTTYRSVDTDDLLALRDRRITPDTPEHIRNAAIAELARRGYATWHVHGEAVAS